MAAGVPSPIVECAVNTAHHTACSAPSLVQRAELVQ